MPRFKSEIYHQCFNILFPEIGKVRGNLFQINGYVKEPLILPEGSGPPVIHSEKVYVPVKEHPDVSIFIIFIYQTFYSYLFSLSQSNIIFHLLYLSLFFRMLPYMYISNIIDIVPQKSQMWTFFNGIKVPIHSGNQKASSRG